MWFYRCKASDLDDNIISKKSKEHNSIQSTYHPPWTTCKICGIEIFYGTDNITIRSDKLFENDNRYKLNQIMKHMQKYTPTQSPLNSYKSKHNPQKELWYSHQ